MAVSKSNLSAFTPGTIGEMTTITRDQALMHDGAVYVVCLVAAAVEVAGTASLSMTVGTQANVYANLAMGMNGAASMYVYEDAGTTEGTDIAAYNMNRASTGTPYVTFVHTPTITTAGTAFYTALAPLGSASVDTVLTAGEYVLLATNNSSTSADINLRATFYEVEV